MSNPGTSKDSYINEEDEDLNFLSEESDIEVYEEDLENPEDERVYEDEQDKPSNLEQFDDQCSLEAHMTFTRLRYNALTRCLKFDLKENRDKKNRLAAIDEIWTAITNRFKMLNEVPGENMCIDESLVSFFGRVIFKMFMPKKSGKFGIKLFNIVDSDSKYCYDSKIYAGKEDDKKTERLSEQEGEYLTIYAVFMDVPMSLTRIRVKATRDVYLLSTFHIPVKMTSSGKLNVVEYYNHKKVGIDQLDEMEKDYGYKPVFKRWTLCVFMWLLNVSAVNCMVLYKKRNAAILEARRSRPMSTRSTPAPEEELIGELLDEDTFRKRFLLDLSQQLMNEQKKKRAETCNDPKYLKMKKFYESMKNLGQEEPHKEQHYCEKCKKSKYRIFFTCAGCNKTGCSDCIKKYDICDECRIEPTPKKMKIEEPRGIPTRSDPSRGQTSSGRCYRCTKVSTFPPCLGNVIQKGHRFCADHRSKRHQKYCETCMP
uniref:PiggyBac transposable element-derived protein domain-containing protein n=1 Tax=Acrobeloides nanus TaxID=290746 RepID=A0A914CLJ3_9BILA